MTQTEWTVPATVERVIDGDTTVVTLDLGWWIYKQDHVRVAHINAPELSTDAGKHAKAYAETLLIPGTKVTIVSHSLDKYGRALGTIVLPDGSDFGDRMLKAGYAVPYEG